MTRSSRLPAALLTVALAGLTSGCGGASADDPAVGAGSAGQAPAPRRLTVLAASSLTEVYGELGRAFSRAHPGATVDFAFDSSATLADQAAQGAPADVLATADAATMATAVDAGAVRGRPADFASNSLVLVTPRDDPGDVSGVRDLDRSGVQYVVCVTTAPCGALAERVLTLDDVTAPPVSQEIDVKAVLARVTGGEADAGVVYATDAVTAGEAVRSIPLPRAGEAPTTYSTGVLAQSEQVDLARRWVAFVSSERGGRALRAAGFGPP